MSEPEEPEPTEGTDQDNGDEVTIRFRPGRSTPIWRPVIPPETWVAMTKNILPSVNIAAQLQTTFNFSPVIQVLGEAAEQFRQNVAAFARNLENFEERWLAALPDNWRDRETVRSVHDVIDLMQETGLCLVWCPRAEVLKGLLEAESAARTGVLLASRELVAEDLRLSLQTIDDPVLDEYVGCAMDALNAFADGHPRAAQALAATCLTALMAGVSGVKKFKHARSKFDKDPMEAGISTFRNWCVQKMLHRSINSFYADRDPVPAEFNRMASAHLVSLVQFNDVNCLAALLLVNAYLRELALVPEDREEVA